jgi:hypothetical protein
MAEGEAALYPHDNNCLFSRNTPANHGIVLAKLRVELIPLALVNLFSRSL